LPWSRRLGSEERSTWGGGMKNAAGESVLVEKRTKPKGGVSDGGGKAKPADWVFFERGRVKKKKTKKNTARFSQRWRLLSRKTVSCLWRA